MKAVNEKTKNAVVGVTLAVLFGLGMSQPLSAAVNSLSEQESSVGVIAGVGDVVLAANTDQEVFERDLQRFAGTYAIFSGLPESDQTAIFRASKDGASMIKIRELVINVRRKHY